MVATTNAAELTRGSANTGILNPAYTGEPLTKWENEPTLEQLKRDLQMGQSHQGEVRAKIEEWREAFKARPIEGKHNKSKIVPKLIRKQAEWRYASLSEPFLSAENLFEVSPMTFEDVNRANQTSLLLNFQFTTQLDLVTTIDRMVRRLVNDGTLVVKTGWISEKETYKKPQTKYEYILANPQQSQMLQQQFQQQVIPVQPYPDSYNQLPEQLRMSFEASQQSGQVVLAIPTGQTMVEATRYKKNQPTLDIVIPENLLIDPTCEGYIERAQFVIHSFETTLSDLKKDSRYQNLDMIQLSSAAAQSDPLTMGTDKNFTFNENSRKKIIVYEYWGNWDIDNSGITTPIVAAWCGGAMIRMDKNPFPDGRPPFVIVPFMPLEGSVFGEPDAELLSDNQRIQGAALRGIMDILGKNAVGQRGTAKNFLDSPNRRKFQNGEDYEFTPNMSPVNSIYEHTFPQLPQSALTMMGWAESDAESLTGVKAFAGAEGINGDALGKTAAGVRSVTDATTKRDMGILRRLSNGLIQIARKVIAMDSVFLDEDQVIRITNEQFVIVRPDDLCEEYDLKIDISTPESDNAKAQETAMMMQTLGNSVDFGITKIMLIKIAKLRNMPDVAQAIEAYQPQPDPMVALQQQLIQAQIQLTQAQTAELSAKGQLNQAKVQKVSADTDKVQADTNQKALDFHEQATGVTHGEEMQKLQAQGQNAVAVQHAANEGAITNTATKALVTPQPTNTPS